MNILLINPPFPQTFWSFNRVLKMLGKEALHPPLGLLTLANLLPDEWSYRLLDLSFQKTTNNDWEWADAVFISGMIVQQSGILQTIREAHNKGKVVVVGGPWAFHKPQEAIEMGASLVVVGEGESTVPILLDHLERRDFGKVIESQERAEMHGSPAPRYELLDLDKYTDMAIQFSRGCPFHCEFCDITLMFGRQIRTKTPEQIINELQHLYDVGWRKSVFFVDDNFIGNPRKAKELLAKMIPWMYEHGHPFDFYTQASVNLAQDDELLDMMVRAGFYRVFLGIETTDIKSLEAAGKKQNVSVDLDEVCRKIKKAGIQIIAGCIVGFDDEVTGADKRLIDFANRNQIPEMFITILQAAPGTRLYERLSREGRLLPAEMDDDCSSQTGLPNFVPTRPIEDIAGEFLNLYEYLYRPEEYLRRAYNHFKDMAPLPYKKKQALPNLFEVRAALHTLLRRGVLSSDRRIFWRYLIRARKNFPDRFHHFFASCVTAEHYYDFAQIIKKKITDKMMEKAG